MKNIFFLLIILFCISCDKTKEKGGIIFTFDDDHIEEWVKYSDLFKSYNIHATFYITRPQLLTEKQIEGLRKLEADGHEIACHGLHHLLAKPYTDSAEIYITKEVLPAKKILENLGFHIVSYAYPYGNSVSKIDSLLLQHFTYIRKARYNIKDTTLNMYNDIFVNNKSFNITNAMGIDYNFSISIENIKTGITRAKANNEIIVLYAHNIDTAKSAYIIQPDYLEEIFKLCNKSHLTSIKTEDIEDFYKKQ